MKVPTDAERTGVLRLVGAYLVAHAERESAVEAEEEAFSAYSVAVSDLGLEHPTTATAFTLWRELSFLADGAAAEVTKRRDELVLALLTLIGGSRA